MTLRSTILFLSYYGPEEAASGIRAGRLARATAKAGERVCFLHGSDTRRQQQWLDGIELTSFPRPAVLSPRGPYSTQSGWAAKRGPVRRTLAMASRSLLQPDRFILSQAAFQESAEDIVRELRNRGESVVCVATGPPWSTMIVAARVTEHTTVPLILDLTDLWSSNPVGRWPMFGHWRAKRWEHQVLAQASGYVCVNHEIQKQFQRLSSNRGLKPWAVAPIGLEREIPTSLSIPSMAPLRIGYFGSIYGDRSFEVLLEALARLEPSPLRPAVHWYGELMGDHPMRLNLDAYVAEGVLSVHSPLSYAAARQAMQSYHLLLVVPSPSYPEELTTKFYDYVDAGRPVLALAQADSLLGRLVRQARVGLVVSPTDSTAVHGQLKRLIEEGVQLTPDPVPLRSHQLPALSEAMTTLLAALPHQTTSPL